MSQWNDNHRRRCKCISWFCDRYITGIGNLFRLWISCQGFLGNSPPRTFCVFKLLTKNIPHDYSRTSSCACTEFDIYVFTTITGGLLVSDDSPCCQCFGTDMVYPKVSFALLSTFQHWHGLSEGIIRPVVNVSALTWCIRRYNSSCCQWFVTDMVYPKVSFALLSMFRHWHGLSEGIIRPVVNVSSLTWFIWRYHSPSSQCFGTDMSLLGIFVISINGA